MRAVAVGLVLLYHAGLRWVPGGFIGVDVFFVISGFLITGMLVREVQETGRLSLMRFYARRVKRLLPAAAIVLVATSLLTWAFVSVVHWRTFGIDIMAAATYLVNWRLADRSVDYLAEDVGASPVQHFWSLAVEEQFYIVWPLLILVVAWWVRRSGKSVRASMSVGLAVVAAPSFVWSVQQTASEPSAAFFVTTTRLWELAVGAFMAIAAPHLRRVPRIVAAAGAWAGLGMVLVGGAVFGTSTPWPGSAALIPTLGTATVIALGVAAGRGGPVVVLGTRPFQWVGRLSYSLYLWHWPLLIVATAYWGELSAARALAVVGVSTIAAWLAFTLIEDPVRKSSVMSKSPRFALTTGLSLSVAGALAGLAVVLVVPSYGSQPTAGDGAALGAVALGPEPATSPSGVPIDTVDWITPDPLSAPEDVPEAYDDDCQVSQESSTPVRCEYGDPEGDKTVALVGDSKALQWLSAMDEIGKAEGWRVVAHTKSACSFTAATLLTRGEPYTSCADWNTEVLDELLGHPPDLVVTSQGSAQALRTPTNIEQGTSRASMVDGLVDRWNELDAAGIQVAVLADTPHPGMNVYECVAENPAALTECTFDRTRAAEASAASTQELAIREVENVAWVDLTDAICPREQCAPVIGNTLVYRQGSHLTDTYVRSLTERLKAELDVIR